VRGRARGRSRGEHAVPDAPQDHERRATEQDGSQAKGERRASEQGENHRDGVRLRTSVVLRPIEGEEMAVQDLAGHEPDNRPV